MSELWQGDIATTASRVPPWVRQHDVLRFQPWSANVPTSDSQPLPRMSNADHDPSHVREPGEMQARAFAEGFEEGRRAIEEIVADERAALGGMIVSLEALRPEPSQALAMLLAETVERLVHQVMGEVSIDRETLLERAQKAADLISEEAGAMRLRMNPEDLALLGDIALDVALVPDRHLTRGTILLENGEGWIEDGPEVRLEKLRAALDEMGIPARDSAQ